MLELDGGSPTDSQPYLGMGIIVVKETILRIGEGTETIPPQRHRAHKVGRKMKTGC
jgi:hypothetical protein